MRKHSNSAIFTRGEKTTFGQAKQRLVAAIYNTAKRKQLFTARDVWAEIADKSFRAQCAGSRLLSAAFRIARRPANRIAEPSPLGFHVSGDRTCHGRPQRLWSSTLGG